VREDAKSIIHPCGMELLPYTSNLVELLKRLDVNSEDLIYATVDLTPECIVGETLRHGVKL